MDEYRNNIRPFLSATIVALWSLLVYFVLRESWNNTQNTILGNTQQLIHDKFPKGSCINQTYNPSDNNPTGSFDAYFYGPARFDCGLVYAEEMTPIDFESQGPDILKALYKCGAIGGWNEDNTSNYTLGSGDPVEIYDALGYFQGRGNGIAASGLYTIDNYGSNIKYYQNFGPKFFTLQIVANTTYDFFNILLNQNSSTPECLNNTYPLDESLSSECAGKSWYISGPYPIPYYCQYGVNGDHLDLFATLNTLSPTNVTIGSSMFSGDFAFLTAAYTASFTGFIVSSLTLIPFILFWLLDLLKYVKQISRCDIVVSTLNALLSVTVIVFLFIFIVPLWSSCALSIIFLIIAIVFCLIVFILGKDDVAKITNIKGNTVLNTS